MKFQEQWERQAYIAGGKTGRAPAQRVGDFLKKQATDPARGEKNPVKPSFEPGVTWTSMEECLPDFACSSLREALPNLGRKLKGFDSPDAVLTGIETRSSSPVRISRDEEYQAGLGTADAKRAARGIFPAGEGAGYAGGITSAAVDGIRIAEQIALNWKPVQK